MGREIGRIVEVKGITVRAELFELLPPYLVDGGDLHMAPRINTLVKTMVGLDTVICEITGEYHDVNRNATTPEYYLDLTVKGYIDGDTFVQGLRLLPIVAASVELLDSKDYTKIYAHNQESSFQLGTDLFDSGRDVRLDYNDIIPSHVGIFGNTGSGKSNTLTKILREYCRFVEGKQSGRILVFDINNEYGKTAICMDSKKKTLTLSTRGSGKDRLPLDIEKLKEDEWCILLSATEATQRPVVKTAVRDNRTENDYCDEIKRILRTGQRHLFQSLAYYLGDYIESLDHFKWNSVYEKFYYEGRSDLGRIYSDDSRFEEKLESLKVCIPTDGGMAFLFKLYMAAAKHIGYGIQYDFISPLLRRAEKLIKDFQKVFAVDEASIFDESNIVVIQLADVNRDMLEIIPSIVANHCFEEQIDNKGEGSVEQVINIVVDEAHNLLYENDNDSRHKSVTVDTFERIIKEGRKFGTYLWIASQRPSDISPTVISQLHNYFIHKLVNPNDISKIRKTVAFLDETALNTITVLGPGECIVSGTAIAMPCFLKVDQVDHKYRPNSENVKLIGENGILTIEELNGDNKAIPF